MFKYASHFFACVLLVLMPLQGFAAAKIAVCNSMMQAEANNQQAAQMPCHAHMQDMKMADKTSRSKSACKSVCATLCCNLCAMTALPSNIKPAALLAANQLLTLADQAYASITQPNLQRPPIFIS